MHIFTENTSKCTLFTEISISCPADRMVQSMTLLSRTVLTLIEPHSLLPTGQDGKGQLLAFLDHSEGGTACRHSSSPTQRHIHEELRKSEADLMVSVESPEAWNLKIYLELHSGEPSSPYSTHTMSSGVMCGTGAHVCYSSSSRTREALQALSEMY